MAPYDTGEWGVAVVVTMTVAALAVVRQIFRAATANPVDTLKKEWAEADKEPIDRFSC